MLCVCAAGVKFLELWFDCAPIQAEVPLLGLIQNKCRTALAIMLKENLTTSHLSCGKMPPERPWSLHGGVVGWSAWGDVTRIAPSP